MKLNIISLFVLIGVLAIAGCAGYGDKKGDGNQIPTPPANDKISGDDSGGAAAGDAQVKEFTVEGAEFAFNPNTITVQKGDKVRVTFKNSGTVIHNFIIDELGVSTKTIPAGETDTVEFTADKTGTFSFYCGVGNHRAKGMEGVLTSGEAAGVV